MRKIRAISAVLLAAVAGLIAYSNVVEHLSLTTPELGSVVSGKPAKTMRPFQSAEDLKAFFKKLAEQQGRRADSNGVGNAAKSASNAAASPVLGGISLDGSDNYQAKEESVTNTQHAGVDEGGIVKVHGDHLVILRRGRLFTVRVGDDSLKPVAALDAFAPGINPSNDWYDEMLVSGDTVVVIGYSYGRGGTEINLFDIDVEGSLDYRSTYHLRSNDYYSSRNYASRLIGSKLIFYTPQYLGYNGEPMERFPAVRRWHKGATEKEFQQRRRTDPRLSGRKAGRLTLRTCPAHCDGLRSRGWRVLVFGECRVRCSGTRVLCFSPTSVYVWTTDWSYGGGSRNRTRCCISMPLDASAPSAVGVQGSPVDQFSFLESDDRTSERSDPHGWLGRADVGLGVLCGRCWTVPCSGLKFLRRQPAGTQLSVSRTAETMRVAHSRTALLAIICCTVPAVAGAAGKKAANLFAVDFVQRRSQ